MCPIKPASIEWLLQGEEVRLRLVLHGGGDFFMLIASFFPLCMRTHAHTHTQTGWLVIF